MDQSRQLAAIMFTDIVGYTALMGNDEQKAFDLLKKNRQIQKPIIEQQGGHWIKELGDGVLASFSTVSDAVTAAIKIQEACNATRDFQLRIGIHLGEVVFEDGDVFGDGVNISSRIQAIADPGCIFVSEPIFQNISNKKDIRTKFVKEEILKNVKEAVRIYEVLIEKNWLPISTPVRPISEKSIAVLPFTNMSSDPEQEYFSDGITEDIIAHISKIRDLKVISRTSVMQYKQTKKSLIEISSDLKVAYILEGSVRRSGGRLRIVAQLIDSIKDEHLWAETYDRDLTDVFTIQTEIAGKIAEGLKASLTSGERRRIAEKPTSNIEAYNFYLLGRSHYQKMGPENFKKAIDYYNKAIELDPAFTHAYASLAVAVLYNGAGYFGIRPNDAMPKALQLANKAIELNPNISDGYMARAEVYDWYSFEWVNAEQDYKKAIELNPNNADAHLYYAVHLAACRRIDEALSIRDRAIELDPYSALIRGNGYWLPFLGGLTEQSIKELLASSVLGVIDKMLARYLYGLFISDLELMEESVSAFRDAYEPSKGTGMETFYKFGLIYGLARAGQSNEARKLLSEIHQREYKEFIWPLGFAIAYAHLKETEKALDYLEKSYEERVGWMLWIGGDPCLHILRKEPRFKDLVRKIGPPEAISEIDKFG